MPLVSCLTTCYRLIMTSPPLPQAEIERIAAGIRARVFEHTLSNNGGYLSQACSSAELLACLYAGAARLALPEQPVVPPAFTGVPSAGHPGSNGAAVHGERAPELDRLIVSPAHYALVVYAALIETGRLDEYALKEFNQDGSTVEMIGAEHSPGFELTTGSLSQALSVAGGIALARRLKKEQGRTWVFMSDGELQEGQTWEAFQALAHYELNTVRVIIDVNAAQCDGPMERVMRIEPVADRIRAFGAEVADVDGHDIAALWEAMHRDSDRPLVILARTDPARGVPLLNERYPVLHYLRFTSPGEAARYQEAYEQMVSNR